MTACRASQSPYGHLFPCKAAMSVHNCKYQSLLLLIEAQIFWKSFRIFIENGYSRNSVPQFLALCVLAFVIRCTEKGYKAITSHR